jgi:alpha-N-arabinofuranosidase
VTRWNSTGELIIKVCYTEFRFDLNRAYLKSDFAVQISNAAASAADLTFVLPFDTVSDVGTAQVISGAGTASNTPGNPNLISPVTAQIQTGQTFNYTAPAISVTVITLSAQ